MQIYYLNCRKHTESKNRNVLRFSSGTSMLSFRCAVCNSQKIDLLKKRRWIYYETTKILEIEIL